MERARQIREEIRRKIEERRQATGGRPVYDPTMPESQQRRPQPQQPMRPVAEATPRWEQPSRPARMPEPVVVKRADSVLAQQASMQRRLEEQRKRLEYARRKQEEARLQARKMEKAAGVRSRSLLEETGEQPHADTSGLRRQVLAGLSDRGGLRKAFLYPEILDPPPGLR